MDGNEPLGSSEGAERWTHGQLTAPDDRLLPQGDIYPIWGGS
jgi:hypothetical protein